MGFLTLIGSWIRAGLPMALLATGVALAALWVLDSRRHWFLRAAVLIGAISLGLLSPSHPHELTLTLLVQAACILATGTFTKIWHAQPETAASGPPGSAEAPEMTPPRKRPQFALKDMLLLVPAVAVVVSFLVHVIPQARSAWPAAVMFGALFALVALGFARAVMDPAGSMARRHRGQQPLTGWRRKVRISGSLLAAPVALLAILLFSPLAMLAYRALAPAPRQGQAVLPIPVNPGNIGRRTPATKPAMPMPNGYNDLLLAAQQFSRMRVPDPERASQEELRAFLDAQTPLFEQIRQGLGRECRVALAYRFRDLMRSPEVFHGAARALAAEARLAEIEGRRADAVDSYEDIIRLGQAIAGGGLAVDAGHGQRVETLGLRGLAKLSSQFSEPECRKAIQFLMEADKSRPSRDDVEAQELLWFREAYGLHGRLMLSGGQVLGEDTSAIANVPEGFGLSTQARTRLLICELALQAYRLKHGREADSLDDLVPELLPAVPADPYGGEPLVYRRDADGTRLYSLGPDRVDDNGQPLQNGVGDLLLRP